MITDLDLMAQASAAIGLDDFADVDGFRTGLRILLADLETSTLPEQDRARLLAEWRRRLEVRLKLVALRKVRPEITREEIEGPLVVTGLPRTGTTTLIDLLAQDPAARTPLSWETVNLFPPPDPDHWHDDFRIAEFDAALAANGDPVQRAGLHFYGPRLPDDCNNIFLWSFWSGRYPGEPEAFHLPGASEWIAWSTPPRPYASHKWVLQHLQAHGPAGRWTLKNPSHMMSLPELVAEYPDAMIVQTHRDPLAVFTSLCGLTATLRGQGPGDPERAQTGRYILDRWGTVLRRCLAARRDPALDGRILDISQRQITRDPMGAVRAIYDRFDLPLTEAAEAAMTSWINHPAQHESKTRFTLEDFDLTEEDVEAATGSYGDRFSAYF